MLTLFSGSPHKLDVLKPQISRGSDDFQTQKAVFFTDIEKVAQIYAIARDKKRERRGWAVVGNQLHIRKPYELNKTGYVYVYSTRSYKEDPIRNPNQYAITRNVTPKYRYLVRQEDIQDNIVEYENKEEWKKAMDELLPS